jgi:pyruvate/2-oxoacid:ferredoxin oxidoreductase beta subunit
MTPYGAHTTFSPPGKVKRLIHTRWKKNMAGMMAAGHPECRYVATVCASYAVEMMNKVRRALSIGGPTFIHSLDPCPKGWDYDPMLSHELGELAIETGVFPLYEVEDGRVKYYGKTKAIVEGRQRKPVREYLLKQGRFAHFTEGTSRTSRPRSMRCGRSGRFPASYRSGGWRRPRPRSTRSRRCQSLIGDRDPRAERGTALGPAALSL